jgi:hypothetical protein
MISTELRMLLNRLQAMTACPGWDLEQGRPVAFPVWEQVHLFLVAASTNVLGWVEPFPSPSGDGTVHLTWLNSDSRLNLEISEGLWHMAFRDKPGADYLTRYTDHQGAIEELIRFLQPPTM